jgi:hypothetical protein
VELALEWGETQSGVEFRLLGAFEVGVRGRVAEIGSVKQRAVLAMLVLHLNAVVPPDRLIGAVWGEHPPPSAGGVEDEFAAALFVGNEAVVVAGAGSAAEGGAGEVIR